MSELEFLWVSFRGLPVECLLQQLCAHLLLRPGQA
jgi:hypothetical protein